MAVVLTRVGAWKAGLGDFEPLLARGRGGRCICNLGQVHDDGAVVSTTDGLRRARPVAGLLVHFDCERVPGLHGAGVRGRAWACITDDVLGRRGVKVCEAARGLGRTFDVTDVTGLLLCGWRTHEPPKSVLPTQNCWNVAWQCPETMKEAASSAARNSMSDNRGVAGQT